MLRIAATLVLYVNIAAAGPCDATIPGSWFCVGGCSAQFEYDGRWNASSGVRAFSFTSDALGGWQTMNGQLSADNMTVTGVFSDGKHAIGNVSTGQRRW
jgi:hypothetical protein